MEYLNENINNKKKNIVSNLLLDEYENFDIEIKNNSCLICNNSLENEIKLSCNHSFCYTCLLESYKGVKCNFYLKNHRICPYCRSPSNYLPLKNGGNPIKGIHREYSNTKKNITLNKCLAIIKTGINKGKQCGCKVKTGNFCGRHNKII